MTARDMRWYGCRRDTLDHRDLPMTRLMASRVTLPSWVDLRAYCPPVMDQGQLGSCVVHAVTGMARYHIIRRGTTYDFPMSRLQLYYDGRAIEGVTASDTGLQIRDAIKVLAKTGVGHEDLWSYDINRFAQRPPQEVYDDAVQYKAQAYGRVPVDVRGIKTALANAHTVAIGMMVYESFEGPEVARDGVVRLPERGERPVCPHAMYIVGYGQKPGYFTARNSWAEDWGDRGDCYIPEAYLGSPENGADYWIISGFGSDAERAAGTA